MPMRHTSRSSLRRGPGVLSMDMLGGGRAIGGLSHMLGEGAGQPRPRLARSKRKLALACGGRRLQYHNQLAVACNIRGQAIGKQGKTLITGGSTAPITARYNST